jgi:hypothetical protein
MRFWAFWILTAVLALLAARHAPCVEPPTMSEAALQGAFREYSKLAEKYRIEIVLTGPVFPQDGSIGGREASLQNTATFLALFKSEWSFYPPELVAASGLRRIIFCEELTVGGHRFGGTAGGGKGDSLYLDVGIGRWSKKHIRELIHHEFFHIMDRRMHLNAGIRHGFEDKQWEALNAPGFKYDPSIKVQPNAVAIDAKLKGFLSKYCQSGVEEDKAVLYGFMVTMGQIVDDRSKTDPVLKAKVDRIKDLVKEFCPQMDDEFWKAAKKVTRYG